MVTTTYNGVFSKDSTPERSNDESLQVPPPRFKPKIRSSTSKIEGRLVNYESKVSDSGISSDDRTNNNGDVDKKDLPKIDILKRRELFENASQNETNKSTDGKTNKIPEELSSTISIKQRLSNLEKREEPVKEASNTKMKRISGDFTVRDRLSNIEKPVASSANEEKVQKVDVPVVPLKERMVTLQSSVPANETDNVKNVNKMDTKPEPKPIERNMSKDKIALSVTENAETLVSMVTVNTMSSAVLKKNDVPIEEMCNISINDEPMLPTSNTDSFNGEKVKTKPLPMKKPEVLPRRQITPDLVKVQPKVEESTVDNLIDLQADQIDDDQDDSVSSNKSNSTVIEVANLTEDTNLSDHSGLVNKIISDDHCNKPMVMVNEKEEEKEKRQLDGLGNDKRVVGLALNNRESLNLDKLILNTKPVSDLKIHVVDNVIESYKPFAVLTPKLTISDNAYVESPQPKSNDTADLTIVANDNDNGSYNEISNNINQIEINSSANKIESTNINNTQIQTVNNNEFNLNQTNDQIDEVDKVVDECPVVEETCKKVDVHKLPDPNNVTTPFIDVPYEKIDANDGVCKAIHVTPKHQQPPQNKSIIFNSVDEILAKDKEVESMKAKNEHHQQPSKNKSFIFNSADETLTKDKEVESTQEKNECHQQPSKNKSFIFDSVDESLTNDKDVESMKAKNERLKCQIVGVLEKNRKSEAEIQREKEKEKNNENLLAPEQLKPPLSPPRSPKSPHLPRSLHSPKSPKKTRTIFDYIKKNLLNEPAQSESQSLSRSESPVTPPLVTNFSRIDHVDNSKFYIPLTDKDQASDSQTIDKDSRSPSVITLAGSKENEINNLLDEELNKLSEDELKH